MHLFTKIHIALFCNFIGKDQLGNRYFQEKKAYRQKYPRRFVLYDKKIDASCIPQVWHAWMHYMIDQPPLGETFSNKHRPNATATDKAFEYDSSVMPSHVRYKSHYTPFNPDNN